MDIKNFDPNGVGLENAGIFGLPFSPDEAQVVLIPAPWGVTVSYGGGTHNAPKAILEASPQIDYAHPSYGADTWKIGIAMLSFEEWQDAYNEGVELRKQATLHIEKLEHGVSDDGFTKPVNEACARFHKRIEKTAAELLNRNKLVGLVGGDHSTSLGLMRALAEKQGDFGILQIDAHCDLREAYEGFTHSHASIMWNALKIRHIKKLVQVGVRDYSISENDVIQDSNGRIRTFFDADMRQRQFEGARWAEIVRDIVNDLPEKIYISFDIDGLEPSLCPHTGTPVPGGLRFQEAMYLVESVSKSGATIVGFDLNEVSPAENNDWDANVGMRVLWNLALWAARSNGFSPL